MTGQELIAYIIGAINGNIKQIIILGIMGGVLYFVCKRLVIFMNWLYCLKRYGLVKFNEQWITAFWKNNDLYGTEIVTCWRVFGFVSGKILYIQKEDDYLKMKIPFQFHGILFEQYLVGIYSHITSRMFDCGCFTLKIEHGPENLINHTIMEGQYSWVDTLSRVPTADKYIWEKISGIKVKKSKIHGNGVFASEKILKNDPIGAFSGVFVSEQSKYSCKFNGNDVEPTGVLKFLNHSCRPNASFSGGEKMLVAEVDIEKEDEIFVDYHKTEGDVLANPFLCNCTDKVEGCVHAKSDHPRASISQT